MLPNKKKKNKELKLLAAILKINYDKKFGYKEKKDLKKKKDEITIEKLYPTVEIISTETAIQAMYYMKEIAIIKARLISSGLLNEISNKSKDYEKKLMEYLKKKISEGELEDVFLKTIEFHPIIEKIARSYLEGEILKKDDMISVLEGIT